MVLTGHRRVVGRAGGGVEVVRGVLRGPVHGLVLVVQRRAAQQQPAHAVARRRHVVMRRRRRRRVVLRRVPVSRVTVSAQNTYFINDDLVLDT